MRNSVVGDRITLAVEQILLASDNKVNRIVLLTSLSKKFKNLCLMINCY